MGTKVIILAGGFGTRISEETDIRPKPMIEIGGKPLLWHIMKMYSKHGLYEFIICCGYKGYIIKEYFANYFLHMSDVTFDMQQNAMQVHEHRAEPWKVTLVDTGEQSMTGGRILRVADFVSKDEFFCLTYGDGLSDIDISDSILFHRSHGRAATLTATFAPGRFGALELDGERVNRFVEKPRGDGAMINGGFFVLSASVFKYIQGDQSVWEHSPLQRLAEDDELMAYRHNGFWHPMDTLRDKQYLERLWSEGRAPWKTWS